MNNILERTLTMVNKNANSNTYVANTCVKQQVEVRRGDIFYVDLSEMVKGINSLQKNIHPVVIISNWRCNENSSIVTGVTLTSQVKNNLPTHVFLEKGYGNLSKGSICLCEQIISLDKKYILNYIGHIENDKMIEIDNAIKVQLQIKNEVCENIKPVQEISNDIERINKAKRLVNIIEQSDVFIINYEPRKLEEALKNREMQIAEFKSYCKRENINSSKYYDEMYYTHKINMMYSDKKVMMG